MSPSERWPAILLHLEPDAWTRAADLSHALGVSERTVYRDVQAMVEAGVPLQGVPGKGYRLPDTYLLTPVQLTTDEAIMLVLGSAYAARNFGGRYQAAARAAQYKLEDILPPEDRERALSLRGSVPLVSPSVFGEAAEDGLLRQARHALVEERTLEATMAEPNGAATPRRIDPYGLVQKGSTWYIVGYGHDRDRVVHLRLPSVETLERTDATFERPSSYGAPPDGPSEAPRHEVRVVFASEAASSVQVPPALTVDRRKSLSDGRLLLNLQVDDEREVMPWLLGYGAHVQVLEPRALRERIAAEAQAVADQYEAVPTLLD
jgi:predicted DNA-binding transcriptional regulator YafY